MRSPSDHQHEQPGGERRLHDDERREQQRDELQRQAEDRQAGAEQPARAAHEPPRQRQAQVLVVRAPPWRPSPAARSLGCRGSTRRRPPRCPAPDRPCPAHDHRSSGPHDRRSRSRSRGRRRRAPTCSRALPRRGRRCARPLGVEDRTAERRRLRADLRRRSAPAGHPGRARGPRRERAQATFFLVGEQVRRNPALAARDRRRRATASALHCDRHRNLLRLTPRAGARRHRARRGRDRRRRPGVAPALYRPPYGVLNAAGAAARAPRAAGARCCGATGGATGSARATPSRSPRCVTDGAGEGSVLLLHDADDYSAPGSWRRTVAALPARARRRCARRGLEPGRRLSAGSTASLRGPARSRGAPAAVVSHRTLPR